MKRKLLNGVRFCSCCGKRILFQGYGDKTRLSHIMETKMLCYDCAYWLNLIEYPPEDMEILGNQCLLVHPHIINRNDKSIILGGDGKKRWFVKPGVKLVESNDIWNIGTVPERFSDRLQPTLYEITEKAYKQLKRNPKWCIARACMDRYNCYRYDLSLEEETGPYNKIPKKWHVGDEHCGFRFENKEILTDDSNIKTLKLLANGKESEEGA